MPQCYSYFSFLSFFFFLSFFLLFPLDLPSFSFTNSFFHRSIYRSFLPNFKATKTPPNKFMLQSLSKTSFQKDKQVGNQPPPPLLLLLLPPSLLLLTIHNLPLPLFLFLHGRLPTLLFEQQGRLRGLLGILVVWHLGIPLLLLVLL